MPEIPALVGPDGKPLLPNAGRFDSSWNRARRIWLTVLASVAALAVVLANVDKIGGFIHGLWAERPERASLRAALDGLKTEWSSVVQSAEAEKTACRNAIKHGRNAELSLRERM